MCVPYSRNIFAGKTFCPFQLSLLYRGKNFPQRVKVAIKFLPMKVYRGTKMEKFSPGKKFSYTMIYMYLVYANKMHDLISTRKFALWDLS